MSALGTPERPLRVAIVGSGPSGFYAADPLLKSELNCVVDMLQRTGQFTEPAARTLAVIYIYPRHGNLVSTTFHPGLVSPHGRLSRALQVFLWWERHFHPTP